MILWRDFLNSPIRDGVLTDSYQLAALETAPTSLSKQELLTNAALGLCGESGEVADLVKKSLYQGHPLDTDHLAKELGDVAWYLAVGAYALDMDLSEVLARNIDKLKARYPDGFDPEKSKNRQKGDL